MTNAQFNKVWDRLLANGNVEFKGHGDKLTICQIDKRYGKTFSLGLADGIVILNHWDKDRFREILVD